MSLGKLNHDINTECKEALGDTQSSISSK